MKSKRPVKDKLALSVRFPKYVGYADYFLRTPVSVLVKNESAEEVSVRVLS